jgi:DTW domain-containing protein YfiP
MHAVQRLYHYRKSLSTTTFKARGQRVIRCEQCRISVDCCICELSPKVTSNAAFLLLMYDTEVLKPSNTGRLIADVIPDTFAFLWSRTEENTALLNVLNDQQWQPFIVFPEQYVEPERDVFKENLPLKKGKRPLFIMLDGSWREAKKMFRKSPYLNQFPVVAFDPEKINDEQMTSRYQIRNANVDNQFATAEVAARMLALVDEHINANLLDLWFDVFSFQYQKSKSRGNKANPLAVENYTQYLEQQTIAKKS